MIPFLKICGKMKSPMEFSGRLEAAILYLLMKAQQKGQNNLSKFEIMKHLYLIQSESYRYTGHGFFDTVAFVRHKNGPISYDIYTALNKLDGKYIRIWEEESKSGYPYPRTCHALTESLKQNKNFNDGAFEIFDDGEKIFLNSVIESNIKKTQSLLKKVVYETEPMQAILEEEKENKNINQRLDFHKIHLDDSIVEAISV